MSGIESGIEVGRLYSEHQNIMYAECVPRATGVWAILYYDPEQDAMRDIGAVEITDSGSFRGSLLPQSYPDRGTLTEAVSALVVSTVGIRGVGVKVSIVPCSKWGLA